MKTKRKRRNSLPGGFSAELKRLIAGGMKAKDAMREAWRKFRGKAATANPRRAHRASRKRVKRRNPHNPAQGTEIYAETEPFTILAKKGAEGGYPGESFQHKHEGGAQLVGYPAGETLRAHPTKRVCLEHDTKDMWDDFEQNPNGRRLIKLRPGQVVVLPRSSRIRVSRKGSRAIVRGPAALLGRARVAALA